MNFYVCDVPEKKGKTATVAKTPKEREFSLKERKTETERGSAGRAITYREKVVKCHTYRLLEPVGNFKLFLKQ